MGWIRNKNLFNNGFSRQSLKDINEKKQKENEDDENSSSIIVNDKDE